MKRTIVKRSAEELEKFFKKSTNKAVINKLSGENSAKKPVSVHQIIENAVLKFEFPASEEFSEDDFEEIQMDSEKE